MTEQGIVVPLDTSLALFASRLATAHGLVLADAVVYATARQAGGELIACDAHFFSLPGVTYFSSPVVHPCLTRSRYP